MEIMRFSGQLAVDTSQFTREERVQLHELYNPQSRWSSGRRSAFSSSDFGNGGWGPSAADRPAAITTFHLSDNSLTPRAIQMMRFLDSMPSKPAYAFTASDSLEVSEPLKNTLRPETVRPEKEEEEEQKTGVATGLKRILSFLGR